MTKETLRLNATATPENVAKSQITSFYELVMYCLSDKGKDSGGYDTNIRKIIENGNGSVTIETYPKLRSIPENPPAWGEPIVEELLATHPRGQSNASHRFNINILEPEYDPDIHQSLKQFVNVHLMREFKNVCDRLLENQVNIWPHPEAEKSYKDYMTEKLLSDQATLARRAETVMSVATEATKRLNAV